jgi:hypothetical protein
MQRLLIAAALIFSPCVALAENVPDAFSVEWQGKHPCEKLYEDAEIRIGRRTFPPGAVHLCHSHSGEWGYGAKIQTRDERGTRHSEAKCRSTNFVSLLSRLARRQEKP